MDYTQLLEGLARIAKALNLPVQRDGINWIIGTGEDTFIQLDAEVLEMWGTAADYTTRQFDLEVADVVPEAVEFIMYASRVMGGEQE